MISEQKNAALDQGWGSGTSRAPNTQHIEDVRFPALWVGWHSSHPKAGSTRSRATDVTTPISGTWDRKCQGRRGWKSSGTEGTEDPSLPTCTALSDPFLLPKAWWPLSLPLHSPEWPHQHPRSQALPALLWGLADQGSFSQGSLWARIPPPI